jgi:hypothetical protein
MTTDPHATHTEFFRTFANRIVAYAVADEDFRKRLLADPVPTLIAEGLPRGVSEDIKRELFSRETLARDGTCGPKSCFWSCIWSCKTATNPV